MASFYVIRGKDNGQHFPIRGAVATIGREAINQIRLRDTEVSRSHARIIRTPSAGHEIEDAGSSNGTFVNSRRVSRKELQSGDRVQVGRTLMIYTGGPEPHSSRSQAAVELGLEHQPADLSQIRSSMGSLHVTVDELLSKRSDSRHELALETVEQSPQHPSSASEPSDLNPALEDSSAQQPSDLEIVYQVGQAISRTGDLSELLNQVLDIIFQWIKCDRACILMLDDVSGQLRPTYSRDRKLETTGGSQTRRQSISRTILDHVVATQEGVLTSNAQEDSRWENVASIANCGVHEAICVPMLGRYGLVGALYVDTQMSAGSYAERQGKCLFDEQHLKLMVAIGGQAALAIEDTQFYHAMLQSERLAAMGQTIANLSHHVKNILQGVRGGSYLVDDGLKKDNLEVVRKGWRIVERNQERISNLVMDMLSFSKEREPEFQRSDLRLLIDDVIDLMSNRATEHAVDLVWNRPAQDVAVDFDSESLHRAVLNVLTNAIDAVSQFDRIGTERGRVSVSVGLAPENNSAIIEVADNGPGIAEEDMGKIFAPFESNKGARGTGLGLPVSQKILREHGGTISVTSQIGDGTRFRLSWPAHRDRAGEFHSRTSGDDLANQATL